MRWAAAICRRARRQEGQVLVLLAVSMVALLGMVAVVFDFGRVYVAQQDLQTAVDAAALVAGQNLPNATSSYSSAVAYGGGASAYNAVGGYAVTSSAPNVTFECISSAPNYTSGATAPCPTDTSSVNCRPTGAQPTQPSGATTCNAVKVTETAAVKMTLAGLFLPTINVTASSTAAARGGSSHPLNVEIILDNTQSISDSCSATVTGISSPDRLDCAKAGVRALLQALWPCSSTVAACGAATANSGGQLGANVVAPVDKVGMLVFPAITGNPPSTASLGQEVDCNASSTLTVTYPTYTPYTYNSGQPDGGIPSSDDYLGYQAVGLSSDYRPSVANTTLNWAGSSPSNLVQSVDWGQCPGSAYPGTGDKYGLDVIGGQGSYLAGAITEAQHLLNLNPRAGATNAIIVLSDGQLNAPKTFTDAKPCTSAINAAAQATAAGTVVYSIAYGADSTACPDKSPNAHTALQTMQLIASNPETFFNQPAAGDLTQAFQQVATDLTNSRLLPDCATPPSC
jgi:Flp pilus assembly protein TadG